MEINKEHLEQRLKQFILQKSKVVEKINELITTVSRIEGAIDTLNLLLKDIDKVEESKE
jgi:hypothetical protein